MRSERGKRSDARLSVQGEPSIHEDDPLVAFSACDHIGHQWEDAGGGLLICMDCQAEKWAEPDV